MKTKEGETMSLEAMKQITAAEQAAKERRAAAEAEARRLTAEAAEQESARQRKQAEARMDAAAELIVERVVKR